MDIVAMNWRGIYVPKGISDERYDEWVETLKKVGASDEWQQVMSENGLASYDVFGAEFEQFVADNIAQIQEVSKEIGLLK